MNNDYLQDVILDILQKSEKPISTKQISDIIKEKNLWQRLKDSEPPEANQIRARVNKYPNLFKMEKGLVSLMVVEQNEKRIARICWNSNNWTSPSDLEGKSTSNNSHERKYGYGHEEWLFDYDKVIDGYHYILLQPVENGRKSFLNKLFDVRLFSRNSESNKNFWIGTIKNLEVISQTPWFVSSRTNFVSNQNTFALCIL
jgi:hypothetical protein